MTKFNKHYIGTGKKVEKAPSIVRFSIPLDELIALAHEWEGKKYCTFETGALLEPDQFGKTHRAWISIKTKE